MYNTELKTRFIREFVGDNDGSYYPALFDRFEKYEADAGCDLCAMRSDKLKSMLENILGYKKSTAAVLYPIKVYIKWCLDNNIPGACDDIFTIDTEAIGLEKIRTRMVSGPAHLQEYLNSLLDPESEQTVDNAVRCFLWLAYGGVYEEDAVKIRASEVNLSAMIITHNMREYEIYREAVPAFKNCMELDSFRFKHPLYPDIIYKSRAEGDILLRSSVNPTIQTFRHKITVANDSAGDMRISYNRAWLSGVFYRMFEFERIHRMKPDFKSLAADMIVRDNPEISEKALRAKASVQASKYSQDYERWKSAYRI